MDRWLNGIKQHADGAALQGSQNRHGTITSYDPANYAVKVMIQPEGVLTGWLPLGALGVGPTSVLVGPHIGDQVVLTSHEGDAEHWTITGRLFDTTAVPPTSPATNAPVQAGEIGLFHASGSYLHMANDGGIHSKGTWTHDGDFNAKGEVRRGYGGGDQVTLGGHTHTQGSDGHGDSEQPTAPPTAGT